MDSRHIQVAAVDPLDRDTVGLIEFFTDLKVICWLAPISHIYLGFKSFIPNFQPKQTLIGDFLEHHATTIFYGKNHVPSPASSQTEDDIEEISNDIEIDDNMDSSIDEALESSLPSDMDTFADDDFSDLSEDEPGQVSEEAEEEGQEGAQKVVKFLHKFHPHVLNPSSGRRGHFALIFDSKRLLPAAADPASSLPK